MQQSDSQSFYPPSISSVLRSKWIDAGCAPSAIPSESVLESLIDVAYQASLLREEDDPVRCRLFVASPDDVELKAAEKTDRLFSTEFDERYELTPHQIRKMAAAMGYYRSLIGVACDTKQLHAAEIWGMVVTGTAWVNQTEVSVHVDAMLPPKLVIHILGPGHLVFAAGLTRVLETVGGQILTEGFDPFRSNWLPKQFASVRLSLLDKLPSNSSIRLCDTFIRDVAQSVVRRVLSLVKNGGHGGMLIYVADTKDVRLEKWLRVRMRFQHGEATNRFQQLMLQLMQRVLELGAEQGIAEVRWQDFLRMKDTTLARIYDSLIEFSHLMADLMSVDGALVLNREFQLIGFGAEILGDSHVSSIQRATDLEAVGSITEPADASGTRHRSAYRLVSQVQETIAVVVSQDGAVRFVAYQGGRLVYWPYLP